MIMQTSMSRWVGTAVLGASFCIQLGTGAADWPGWRGPDRADVSHETGLLKSWPADGPRQLWVSQDAGLGYSGPAIVDGKLYTLGARDKSELLIAVDAGSGKLLWSVEVGDLLTNGWGDGPRGTPSVDGDRVYALTGRGTLVCADVKDGRVVWKRAMDEFGGKVPGWGYTESVLIDGDHVVCTPGGSKGTIVSLNKATGELVWQSKDLTEDAHYSSIIVAEPNGTRQYIKHTEKKVSGVSAADGSLLWTTDFPGRTAVIPTPIFQDGYVYVTAGYGAGCKLLKIGAGNKVEEVYNNRLMKNHHGGVVLVGDHLYGYSDGVGWLCQDFKTGEEVWSERKKLGKGAVTCADGMLYCLDEETGAVVLVEASPKGWNEKGRFLLEPQSKNRSSRGKVWTHPVISGGKLYLRDQEHLYCYDISG
jgi:outer membrane protein assembly factor BamB